MKRILVIGVVIVLLSVFLVLSLPRPSALAQYSWTDTIEIYRDVEAVYTNIRKITNNEAVTVDVRVYITLTEEIDLLEYYKVSANVTDFIIISQGVVTLSNGTYYGLEQGQTLYFTVHVKGSSSLPLDGSTVKVGVKLELWSAEITHDVAATALTLSKNVVGEGFLININVTIQNQGSFTETFNVSAYANTSLIDSSLSNTLASGNSTTITFTWNTTDFVKGNYTIWVYVTPVPGETDTADNTLIAAVEVCVTIPGDVDADFDVDIYDAVKLGRCYEAKEGEPNYDPNFDINGDGRINLYDAVILCTHYGEKDP